jgi:hypothetical protein
MDFKGTIPPELIQSIKNNRCILFIGSGLSAKVQRSNNKSLPLWGAFLSELLSWAKSKNAIFWNGSEEIEEIIKKGNYLLAAQELQECISLGEFSEFLNSVFRDRKVIPSKTHLNIFKTPFRAILTTNYDTLIEGAFALTHEGQVPVKFIQEDLKTISSPLRSEEFFLFKIHGDIDRPESIILGSRSYNQLLFRTPEYLHFLETLFTTHTVLFVGFSGNDIDLDFVIDRLSTIYSRTLNKHYILLPKSKYNLTEKRRLLLDRRLEVVEYEEDPKHIQVDYFFDTLDKIINHGPTKETIQEVKTSLNPLADILILSSKLFNSKHEKLVTDVIRKSFPVKSTAWFFGFESVKNMSAMNDMIASSNVVFIFFDNALLKIKEIESLFELITLREIDQKVKIIPIAIGMEPINLPKFLLRRIIYVQTELTRKVLEAIIKDVIHN